VTLHDARVYACVNNESCVTVLVPTKDHAQLFTTNAGLLVSMQERLCRHMTAHRVLVSANDHIGSASAHDKSGLGTTKHCVSVSACGDLRPCRHKAVCWSQLRTNGRMNDRDTVSSWPHAGHVRPMGRAQCANPCTLHQPVGGCSSLPIVRM
jgi:hypothetical protein